MPTSHKPCRRKSTNCHAHASLRKKNTETDTRGCAYPGLCRCRPGSGDINISQLATRGEDEGRWAGCGFTASSRSGKTCRLPVQPSTCLHLHVECTDALYTFRRNRCGLTLSLQGGSLLHKLLGAEIVHNTKTQRQTLFAHRSQNNSTYALASGRNSQGLGRPPTKCDATWHSSKIRERALNQRKEEAICEGGGGRLQMKGHLCLFGWWIHD